MTQSRRSKRAKRTKIPGRKSRRRQLTSKKRRGGRLHFSRPLHSTKKGFYKYFGRFHSDSRKNYENNHKRKILREKLKDYYHKWSEPISGPTNLRKYDASAPPLAAEHVDANLGLENHLSNGLRAPFTIRDEAPHLANNYPTNAGTATKRFHVSVPTPVSTGMRPMMAKKPWRP